MGTTAECGRQPAAWHCLPIVKRGKRASVDRDENKPAVSVEKDTCLAQCAHAKRRLRLSDFKPVRIKHLPLLARSGCDTTMDSTGGLWQLTPHSVQFVHQTLMKYS
jgi:hypothetical protein